MLKEILNSSCKDVFLEMSINSDPFRDTKNRNVQEYSITSSDLKYFLQKNSWNYDDLVTNWFIMIHSSNYLLNESSKSENVLNYPDFLKLIEQSSEPKLDSEEQNMKLLFNSLVGEDTLKKVVSLEKVALNLQRDYGITLDCQKIENDIQTNELTYE